LILKKYYGSPWSLKHKSLYLCYLISPKCTAILQYGITEWHKFCLTSTLWSLICYYDTHDPDQTSTITFCTCHFYPWYSDVFMRLCFISTCWTWVTKSRCGHGTYNMQCTQEWSICTLSKGNKRKQIINARWIRCMQTSNQNYAMHDRRICWNPTQGTDQPLTCYKSCKQSSHQG